MDTPLDCLARCARLEERMTAFNHSLNRHEEHLSSIEQRMEKSRGDSAEAVKELSQGIVELKTKVFGSMLAAGILIALMNLIGTVVGIWAALR